RRPYFFFFSSRRRHTRSYGDWSSDVCSSDLDVLPAMPPLERSPRPDVAAGERVWPVARQRGHGRQDVTPADRDEGPSASAVEVRSEERRVGKEGGAGWGAEEERTWSTESTVV